MLVVRRKSEDETRRLHEMQQPTQHLLLHFSLSWERGVLAMDTKIRGQNMKRRTRKHIWSCGASHLLGPGNFLARYPTLFWISGNAICFAGMEVGASVRHYYCMYKEWSSFIISFSLPPLSYYLLFLDLWHATDLFQRATAAFTSRHKQLSRWRDASTAHAHLNIVDDIRIPSIGANVGVGLTDSCSCMASTIVHTG